MDGYSAQLPHHIDTAAADCLDEMHRFVAADRLSVAAIVGYEASRVTPEDRTAWPAFHNTQWFAALPEGAGVALGCGAVNTSKFALEVSSASMMATVAASKPQTLPEGVTCAPIDEKRWLISCPVPEAGAVYAALKKLVKGRVEAYLESASANDDRLGPLNAANRHFGAAYDALARVTGKPAETVGCGASLLKSPAWAQKIADALGASITLCTEPEPAARGAALWTLERIGAIGSLEALAASTANIFNPVGKKSMNHELLERASRIRLLLMDVDGVLTDAKLYNVPGPDGKMWETKGFDAQDGIALQWMNWYGIQTGVISGRVSPATEERARQVKMTYVYQGHIEKIPILEEICAKSGIPADQIAYIGDDLTDVVIMRRVLLGFATANARPEVKKAAHMVLAAAGGSGAVREVCELLLQAQGKWPEILKKYEIE